MLPRRECQGEGAGRPGQKESKGSVCMFGHCHRELDRGQSDVPSHGTNVCARSDINSNFWETKTFGDLTKMIKMFGDMSLLLEAFQLHPI